RPSSPDRLGGRHSSSRRTYQLRCNPSLRPHESAAATLLRLLEGWREQAVRSGQLVSRIVLAFEAGRDGFWLARWLRARDIVLVAPTVLPHVPSSRRGLASGSIFVGIGCGIVASGTLVPTLLRWGLVPTWCGLGIFALLLSIIAWNGWPDANPSTPQPQAGDRRFRWPRSRGLGALYLEYALN